MPQVAAARGPLGDEASRESLRQVRLAPVECAADPRAIEGELKRMRAEVDAQFKVWHDEQPACWHDLWLAQHPQPFGIIGLSDVGGSFAAGGLGLSGTGEGGGGYGVGFGSGHGRLGGAHAGGASLAGAGVFSGTNDQVAGVDEADIVKTDGRYVYLAANGALRIVEAMRPRLVSVTALAGAARELFIAGDRAVVYTSSAAPPKPCRYGYDCRFAGDGTSTRITVLDVSDRARPKALRAIELSGSLIASRRIGDAVHTVVADGDAAASAPYPTWPLGLAACGTDEKFVRAKFAQLKWDNEQKIRAARQTWPALKDRGVARSLCPGMLRTALADGRAFTTIVSFDLASDAPPVTAAVQSRPGAVYAAADALYFAVMRDPRRTGRGYGFEPPAGEVSEVHAFRIGGEAGKTRYLGSGVVPGHVLNQFAMDEWQGKLRIATTSGRVPDPRVTSTVSILALNAAHELVRVGAIGGIAPGEDIRAVRFDGDRGYVVTFKKTDPLFVLDLGDGARPVMLGELKIPGFSTYLHRIDARHLLSIGFDANDHGSFAYFDGLLLQLFDVSDPLRPLLLHREKIGTRGSSSEAATDHLAFDYLPERGLLAIPATVCEGGGDGAYGRTVAFSGLLVYRVDLDEGFTRLGGIARSPSGASCNRWWSDAGSAVKRSLFLDDLVYAIGEDRLQVQRLGAFGRDVADIALR